MVDTNIHASPNADRTMREEYFLEINESADVIQEYTNGDKLLHSGTNVREFPYRSIIRGDYESEYGGLIPWLRLERFRTHLLDNVLSWNNKKLPESLWNLALNNYINNNVAILTHELQRWYFQYNWYHVETLPSSHDFFDNLRLLSVFTYEWQGFNQSEKHTITVNPASRLEEETVSLNGESWVYVKDYSYTFIEAGLYEYFKIGEAGEFAGYMPEYEKFDISTDLYEQVEIDGEIIDVYYTTKYSPSHYDIGLLTNLIFHLNQLRSLKYDYSNLDDVLTKNWLYLKVSSPCIEPIGEDEVRSSMPYYNEVYIKNQLADQYLLCVLDTDPCVNQYPTEFIGQNNVFSDPDFLVREKLYGQNPAGGVFIDEFDECSEDTIQKLAETDDPFGKGETMRPYSLGYQFLDKVLFYEIETSPYYRNNPKNPRIVPGVEYVFESANGQPNEGVLEPFSIVPMRLRLEAVYEIRDGSKVLMLDSNAFDIEEKIDEVRALLFPTILDGRLSVFEENHSSTPKNAKTIDYLVNVVKEFTYEDLNFIPPTEGN